MNRLIQSSLRVAQRGPTKALAILHASSASAVHHRSTNIAVNTIVLHRPYGSTPIRHKIEKANTDMTDEEAEALLDAEIALMEEEAEAKKFKDWKPGQRKRPLVIAHNIEDFENESSDTATSWRPQLHKRTGALGIKVGMMPIWDSWGERHACTVLYLDNNVVLRTFQEDEDGYTSVQIGAGERKAKNVTKPLMGHYRKYGVDDSPPYIVRQFKITHDSYLPEPGTKIHARHFLPGQNVDVSAISKGKGFQGAMKKWNFSGMPASHGTSLSHRSLGSTGQCQDPGRVFKGKKMAGRMGGKRVTTQNLRIVKIDRGRNLVYVKGAVPGQKGEFVEIRDAIKKPLFGTDLVEGAEVFPPLPTFVGEEGLDGSGEGGHEVMMPLQDIDPFDPPMDEAA